MGTDFASHVIGNKDALDNTRYETRAVWAEVSWVVFAFFASSRNKLVRHGAVVYDSELVIFHALKLVIEPLLDSICRLPKKHLKNLIINEMEHINDLQLSPSILTNIPIILQSFLSVRRQLQDLRPQRQPQIVQLILNVILILLYEILSEFVQNMGKNGNIDIRFWF